MCEYEKTGSSDLINTFFKRKPLYSREIVVLRSTFIILAELFKNTRVCTHICVSAAAKEHHQFIPLPINLGTTHENGQIYFTSLHRYLLNDCCVLAVVNWCRSLPTCLHFFTKDFGKKNSKFLSKVPIKPPIGWLPRHIHNIIYG